eukprot:gene23330-30575_t
MYYSESGSSQCLDHINMNARSNPRSYHYKRLSNTGFYTPPATPSRSRPGTGLTDDSDAFPPEASRSRSASASGVNRSGIQPFRQGGTPFAGGMEMEPTPPAGPPPVRRSMGGSQMQNSAGGNQMRASNGGNQMQASTGGTGTNRQNGNPAQLSPRLSDGIIIPASPRMGNLTRMGLGLSPMKQRARAKSHLTVEVDNRVWEPDGSNRDIRRESVKNAYYSGANLMQKGNVVMATRRSNPYMVPSKFASPTASPMGHRSSSGLPPPTGKEGSGGVVPLGKEGSSGVVPLGKEGTGGMVPLGKEGTNDVVPLGKEDTGDVVPLGKEVTGDVFPLGKEGPGGVVPPAAEDSGGSAATLAD